MFQLEKYKSKKTRHTCPVCGKKWQFARYVDGGGKYIADDVGRCNRESSCGYHRTPKEHFADDPTDREQRTPRSHAAPRPKAEARPDHFDTIPQHRLDATLCDYDRNGFVQFLLTHFAVEAVTEAIAHYFIGTTQNGRAVFWQVDGQGRIRTAKLIKYDAATGKRDKESNASWEHAELKRRSELPEAFALSQCFFGEQLLTDEPHATVAVVEAEKTAVIASLILPEFTWLATGGKTNSIPSKLATLRNRRVILFPDADGFAQWSEYAAEVRAQGFDVECSDLIETNVTPEEKASGYDVADYLLASIAHQQSVFAKLHDSLSEADAYALDERAAVYEFEARYTRSEAEVMAANEWP